MFYVTLSSVFMLTDTCRQQHDNAIDNQTDDKRCHDVVKTDAGGVAANAPEGFGVGKGNGARSQAPI